MGSFSRKMRRKIARGMDHSPDQNARIREEMARVQEQRRFDNDALTVMYHMLALANHDLYGHGRTRTLRSLEYYDHMIGEMNAGRINLESLRKRLKDELGIEVKL